MSPRSQGGGRRRRGSELTLDGGLLDVGHVLSVGELSEERGRSNDDIDSVNTCEQERRWQRGSQRMRSRLLP